MSLILEALRKSEAERRRGHMPGLHAELPPVPSRVPAAAGWPWRIAFATSALLALAAWLATSAWRPHAAAPASPPPTATSATEALPRIPHLRPAMPAEPPPARPEAKRDAEAHADASAEPPVPRASPSAPAPPVDAAATAPDTDRPATRAATRVAQTGPSPGAVPPAPTAPLPPTARTTGATPLQLADLSPEERKALPPLRLSMHLWNDDATRRFVILDGNRLGEGDRFGNLVVTAIVRDGVLLDWNGRAIKVPLR